MAPRSGPPEGQVAGAVSGEEVWPADRPVVLAASKPASAEYQASRNRIWAAAAVPASRPAGEPSGLVVVAADIDHVADVVVLLLVLEEGLVVIAEVDVVVVQVDVVVRRAGHLFVGLLQRDGLDILLAVQLLLLDLVVVGERRLTRLEIGAGIALARIG